MPCATSGILPPYCSTLIAFSTSTQRLNDIPSYLHSMTLRGAGITLIPDQVFKSFDASPAWTTRTCGLTTCCTHFPHSHRVSNPSHVSPLPQLTSPDVSSNRISCGCLMKWMLDWELRDDVTIRGSCSNNQMSIQDFDTTKI